MTHKLPATMLAVQLDEVGQPLSVRQIPMPKPGKGEVLVKMAASPINPSDLAFLAGSYVGFNKKFPLTPGNEGSGTVVASGPGFMGKRLLGKNIACFAPMGLGGAWAEYMVTKASFCITMPKTISLEESSMALINPLTAHAFMKIIQKGKHKSFVNTAAASALGKMLIRLSNDQNVPLINIVRKESQMEELRSLGASHVVNSAHPDFTNQIKDLMHQLNTTLILDAVGGPLLGQLLLAAPQHSTILCYGRMSDEPCIIEPGTLILHHKQMKGFFLGTWMLQRNIIQMLNDIRSVKALLGSSMKTEIRSRMPLESINEAIEQYTQNMSKGKILITPGK